MGTEFDVRLWFDGADTATARLARVVDALAGHDIEWGPWAAVEVERADRTRRTIAGPGLGPAELAAAIGTDAASGDDGDSTGRGLVRTGVEWPIWRLDRGRAVRGGVHLCLEAWPSGWPTRPVPDLDGHVTLWAPSAAFVTGRRGRPSLGADDHDHAVARIEDNVQALVDLLSVLIAELRPRKLALHHGNGMHHTLNANALWLPAAQDWIDELDRLETLWAEGCPVWKLGPLDQPPGARSAWALHEGRSPEQRSTLWARLAAALANRPRVGPADVDPALGRGPFDVFETGGGRLVLDLADPFGAFAGEALVDLLEARAP